MARRNAPDAQGKIILHRSILRPPLDSGKA
jgi:hypothetical protein